MMRRVLAPLLLAALCLGQGADGLRQASGAAFSGFGDDDKAEKTWEIGAATVRPDAVEPGAWRLTDLVLTTFRDGRAHRVLRTPTGVARPERRAAQGDAALRLEGEGLRLEGVGWTWRGTDQGDTFSLLALVRGVIGDPAAPGGPARLSAARIDVASAADGGTDLAFAGGARMERGTETLTADKLVLTLGRDGALRSWAALGGVRHELEGRLSQADEIRHDAAAGRTRFLGAVRAADARATLAAAALTREADGAWTAEDPEGVRAELPAAEGRPAALAQARTMRAFPAVDGESLLVLDGAASYRSGPTELLAATLRIGTPARGAGWIEAEGGAKGTDGPVGFQAGEARLDRETDELLLQGSPRLVDRRGFVLSGFQIRARPAAGTAEVLSGIGRRAVMLASADGAPAELEADRIEASRQGDRALARLVGSVRLRLTDGEASCDRLVATARLGKDGAADVERLVLVGDVRYRTAGFAARAGRAELHPAVGLESAIAAELGGASRLLLLLPDDGGDDARPPRLEISQGEGLVALDARRHEVLLAATAARFHSEGSVRIGAGAAEGACERVQGLARRDGDGRLALVSALGSGSVTLVSGATRATGERLELDPAKGVARLRGGARIQDAQGRMGMPADAIAYDLRARSWSMDSAPGARPGEVVRPRILLPGTVFELPLPQ